MTYEEKARVEEEAAHVKWAEEMQSLRWNNTDRAEILDLLLETYDLAWVDAIEDILNSEQAEDMKHLILTVKNRRKL